jgi:TonB family protein
MKAPAFFVSLITLIVVVHVHARESEAILSPDEISAAVDAKGVRHTSNGKSVQLDRWLQDCIRSVAPVYPRSERAARHQGSGRFRIQLDLTTGRPASITVITSTGYQTLDRSAITALRQWRWRAGRWKEIEMPVTFNISATFPTLKPGSVRLPDQ